MKADLEVCEELAAHDALQKHVQISSVFVAGQQVDHVRAAALSLHLLLPSHMLLHHSCAQL